MRFRECYEAVQVEKNWLLIPVGDESRNPRGMFAMNEEVMWMIQKMQKNDLTLEQLAEGMCQEYDADFETAKRDIAEKIRVFDQMGLLVG